MSGRKSKIRARLSTENHESYNFYYSTFCVISTVRRTSVRANEVGPTGLARPAPLGPPPGSFFVAYTFVWHKIFIFLLAGVTCQFETVGHLAARCLGQVSTDFTRSRVPFF